MMKRSILCTFLLVAFFTNDIYAQRISTSINSNWLFFKGDSNTVATNNKWHRVNIPHTWNDKDVMDDEHGYYRGDAWYKKMLYIPASWKDKEVYIYFEGVGQVADVFVNGTQTGSHTGGYTFFSFPISKYLQYNESGNAANVLTVKVNNQHNNDIPPLSGDYTFFGGIYRDVYLKAYDKIHFDADNHASNGIFITTPRVTNSNADVHIKGAFVNGTAQRRQLQVMHQIVDASGKTVATQSKNIRINAGEKIDFTADIKNISNIRLWSLEDPYVYRVVSTITDATTKQRLDEVTNPLGFRYYTFDAAKGFFLNGKHVKLVGASRHQDFKSMGNALSDAMHVRDVELLKQMGGNFLRIAHYPQDPSILEACDRMGILAAIETPSGNSITETEGYRKNYLQIHREMIRQNYNHPSLIIWAYMNEVLLRVPFKSGTPGFENYLNSVTKLAQQIEDLTRAEDPYRYTLIPNHGAFELYNKAQLTTIPMLVGWNLYQGWYSNTFEGFSNFLDKHHKELPNKPLLVTEYGSDADSRLHDFTPVRFDKTVEYTNAYHKYYLRAMLERPFVAAAMIWNLAEFSSEQRGESTPHVNAKGILAHDRQPKDGYRFYQANLLKEPFVQIGSKEWTLRTGFAEPASLLTHTQPVTVFTNHSSVTLKHNGKVLGTRRTDMGMATFNVPFVHGINRLVAAINVAGNEVIDHADIRFKMLSQDLGSTTIPFEEMNVSMGDKRMFHDALAHQVWIPEQEYKPGSWGYIGGKVFTMANTSRHSYGSEKDVLGTDLDPVYATMREGIEQMKFDVPAGDYEVTLHFAELISSKNAEELAYNLGSGVTKNEDFVERIFNVAINGQEVLSKFSNAEALIPVHAVASKYHVSVNNNEGITIQFTPVKGQPILNGLQVRKVR